MKGGELVTIMSERNNEQYRSGEPASAEQQLPSEALRRLELSGCQNIVELLRYGRVRLSGEDGATVELWEPEEVEGGGHRVKLDVSFSDGMRDRYPEPLPPNPTSIVHNPRFIEPGSRNYGGVSLEVEGWGLYGPDGRRARHNSRRFVLRDVTKVELMVPADTVESPSDRALGAGALRAISETAE